MRAACAVMVLLIGGLVSRAQSLSAEPASLPTTRPTTQPAGDQRIRDLIGQLASDDFRQREEAASQIRKMGRAALPALKEALSGGDPEIQSRASALVKQIEDVDRRAARARTARSFNGASSSVRIVVRDVNRSQVTVTETTKNGDRRVNVNDNGRRVFIHENADGLTISVTEAIDGKEATREFRAKDADGLQKDNPEAFKLYEKYSGMSRQPIEAGGVRANIRRGRQSED